VYIIYCKFKIKIIKNQKKQRWASELIINFNPQWLNNISKLEYRKIKIWIISQTLGKV
jgi:hypothetical protein